MPYYHSRTWFGTEAFTYYNSHTSQHAEGSDEARALLSVIYQVMILSPIASRFTQLNPLNGKLAVSSTSWKEIVEFVGNTI
jgi:hypothetical protein